MVLNDGIVPFLPFCCLPVYPSFSYPPAGWNTLLLPPCTKVRAVKPSGEFDAEMELGGGLLYYKSF